MAVETVGQANLHIESRRNTELYKVLKEPGMKDWLHKTFRETQGGHTSSEPCVLRGHAEVLHAHPHQ